MLTLVRTSKIYRVYRDEFELGVSGENSEVTFDNLYIRAFRRLQHNFKNQEISINLGRKVYNSWILPVVNYGLGIMTLTAKNMQWLKTTQRSIERAMTGVSKRDHIRNEETEEKLKCNR